uniref:Uncharacterized protein n=1 Tax=Panagrolaimus superbus TaxID=310955 RepID=A0A914YAX2_9BILA
MFEVFSVSYSCARWPASTSSLSDCDPSLTPQQCLNFYREQGALIEVYFEQLNYESLLESEAYGLPNLLSDFGGQLGLWMGVSVITIMEVTILAGELLFNILCCCCRSYEIPATTTRSTERRLTQRQSTRRRLQYPNGSFRYDLQRPYIFNGGGYRRGSPPLPHIESGYDIVRNIR